MDHQLYKMMLKASEPSRRLQASYVKALEATWKNGATQMFREAHPDVYEKIAIIRGRLTGGRRIANMQSIFLYVYGRCPRCRWCREPAESCLKAERPQDLSRFCSRKCAAAYTIPRIRAACREQYGTDNVFASEMFKNNRVRFLQDKYGEEVTGPLLVPGALEKVRRTSLENFGVEHFAKAAVVKEKKAKTNMKHHGVTCYLATAECIEKRKAACEELYGVDHPSKADAVKRRKMEKSKLNFGVDHPTQSDVIQTKIRATNLARHGSEHPNWVLTRSNQFLAMQTGYWRSHEIQYQGYELRVLKSVEHRKEVVGIKMTGRSMPIKYKDHDKVRSYYPDFLLKTKKAKTEKVWVVEVKSFYTLFGEDRRYLKKNLKKFRAAEKYALQNDMEFVLALVIGGETHWLRTPSHRLISRVKQLQRRRPNGA